MEESRQDLHWLALQLFRRLGTAELPVVDRHGLSLWGYEVLVLLCDRPSAGQVELVAELRLDKTKVMRVVDELEGAGLAVRGPDPSDRRRHAVSATERGRAVRAAVAAELARIEDDLFDQLPPAVREPTRTGLRALVAALITPARGRGPG
jgi:DNA-binding MarR family transcriptional regulator